MRTWIVSDDFLSSMFQRIKIFDSVTHLTLIKAIFETILRNMDTTAIYTELLLGTEFLMHNKVKFYENKIISKCYLLFSALKPYEMSLFRSYLRNHLIDYAHLRTHQ